MTEEMSLSEALYVLCGAHTREDDLVGYTVSEGADTYFLGHGRYIQAWGVVRRAIGQTFEPARSPMGYVTEQDVSDLRRGGVLEGVRIFAAPHEEHRVPIYREERS